jgi:acetyl-CoA carboxylase carboxyl transferase subunit alpha
MLKNKLIDGIIPEPVGGAHSDVDEVCRIVKAEVKKHLDRLTKMDPGKLVDRRIAKFCDMGVVHKAKGKS